MFRAPVARAIVLGLSPPLERRLDPGGSEARAGLTELYLAQPLRDMTDRCISVLIRSLSPWPPRRIVFFPLLLWHRPVCLSLDSTSCLRPVLLWPPFRSLRFHFRLSRVEGVWPPGAGDAEDAALSYNPTTDDLIKNESVGEPRRLITRLARTTKIDATARSTIAFMPHRRRRRRRRRRFSSLRLLPEDVLKLANCHAVVACPTLRAFFTTFNLLFTTGRITSRFPWNANREKVYNTIKNTSFCSERVTKNRMLQSARACRYKFIKLLRRIQSFCLIHRD